MSFEGYLSFCASTRLHLTAALLSSKQIKARQKFNPEVTFPGYPLSPIPWLSCQTQLRDSDKRPPPSSPRHAVRSSDVTPQSHHNKALHVPRDGMVTPHRRQDRNRHGVAGCSPRAGGSEEPAYNLNLLTHNPNPKKESLHT